MSGRTSVTIAIVLLTAALSGCTFSGGNNPSGSVQNLNPASEQTDSGQTETKPENTNPEENKSETEGKDSPEAKPAAVSGVKATSINFERIYDSEGAKEKAVITGSDVEGNVLWVYETEEDYLTELERLSDIITTDDEYIFVAFGDVIALDLATGEEKWVNHDFKGASPYWTMDYEGSRLFLTGYYGPTLFVMDFDGNTINRITSADDEYFWPSEVVFVNDRQVDITFESNGKTKSFDPDGDSEQ